MCIVLLHVRASDDMATTGHFYSSLLPGEYCTTSTMETHSEAAYDKDTGQYTSLREQWPQGNDKTMMSKKYHRAVRNTASCSLLLRSPHSKRSTQSNMR